MCSCSRGRAGAWLCGGWRLTALTGLHDIERLTRANTGLARVAQRVVTDDIDGDFLRFTCALCDRSRWWCSLALASPRTCKDHTPILHSSSIHRARGLTYRARPASQFDRIAISSKRNCHGQCSRTVQPIEHELDCECRQQHAGDPSHNVRPGFAEQLCQSIRSEHRHQSQRQTQYQHKDDRAGLQKSVNPAHQEHNRR